MPHRIPLCTALHALTKLGLRRFTGPLCLPSCDRLEILAAVPSSKGQKGRQDRPAEPSDQNVIEANPLLVIDHGRDCKEQNDATQIDHQNFTHPAAPSNTEAELCRRTRIKPMRPAVACSLTEEIDVCPRAQANGLEPDGEYSGNEKFNFVRNLAATQGDLARSSLTTGNSHGGRRCQSGTTLMPQEAIWAGASAPTA